MKKDKLFLLYVCLGLLPLTAYTQSLRRGKDIIRIPEPGMVQLMTTRDGVTYIGTVTRIKAGKVEFDWIETEADTTFALDDIIKIREIPVSDVRNGKYWFPNPNASRIHIAQTGRPLPKGHGYIADYVILLPVVAYAITDNITIAGGATFINQISFTGFYFLPKAGFNIDEKFAVAVGGGWIQALGVEEDFINVGFVYGAATLGNPDASITTGVGYGFSRSRGDWIAGQDYQHNVLLPKAPGLLLGGDFRLGRRFCVLTENYLIHDLDVYRPILGYGVRMFGENYSAEVVLYNAFGYQGLPKFPGLPFIGIIYNF